MKKVAVIGSLNTDILVNLDQFPKEGETVQAKSIQYKVGGKGINQAAASAALGVSTIILGTVGDDSFGQDIIGKINRLESLDASRVKESQDLPTGMAVVEVCNGENKISITAGANSETDKKFAEENENIFKEADVVLTQFEIPIEANEKALTAAHTAGTITILNPAPFIEFPLELLKYVDVITPNVLEFTDLAVHTSLKPGTLEERMLEFQKKYPDVRLVVTKGKDGLSYVENGEIVNLEAIKVDEVDSTGAGDVFAGALAGLLSGNMGFEEAVYKAAVAAGLSVAHEGALGAAPKMEEVDFYINQADV